MPLLDLVTPWAAARGASDATRAMHQLLERHAAVLERIRRQRAPHLETLPLTTDRAVLARAAARAADASFSQQLRDAEQAAARLGADLPHSTVLVAGSDEGEAVLPLPGAPPLGVLFLGRGPDNTALPLSHAVFPATPTHRLIGLRRGEVGRLRERERTLNALLTPDLDESGLGLVLRWLVSETPAAMRTYQGTVIPPGAGRYLAWRLTADRVARVGVREALRLPA